MGFTHNLGTIAQGVFSDSSLNIGIGAAPSGSYKFETTGTAKISSTLLVSGVTTFGSTLSNGTYSYTLPGATGTLALVGGAGVGTVTSVAAITLGTTGTDLSSTVANGTTTPVITLQVPTASAANRGALSSADWTIFNNKAAALSGTINTIAYWDSSTTIASLALATYPSLTELSYVKGVTSAIQTQLNAKQATITLTTTGTSGAATFVANTLNIPNYATDLTGYVPYTGATQTLALGTNNGITLTDTGSNQSISITSTSTGSGAIYITKSGTGTGIQVANSGTGFGIYANNSSTGYGITIGNSSTGKGLYIDNAASATGDPFVYTLGGAAFVKAKIDYLGNITGVAGTFTGQLTLGSTITNGTYTYTLPSATGTLALTSALSGYLPLTGGTLTGALSGTSATFSGNMILNGTDSRFNGGDSVGRLIVSNSNTTTYIGLYGATHPTTPYIMSFVVNSASALSIASTGAATFSSSLTIGASTALSWGVRGNITQDASYNFTWNTNGVANAFYLQSSTGNVGIGTTSPGTIKLVVNQTAGVADYTARFIGSTTTGASYGVNILAGTNSSDLSFVVRDVTNTNTYLSIRGDGAATFSSTIQSGGDISLMNSSGDISLKMKDSGGNADRVLSRQATTNDVYVGDIDANGGQLILRANGNNNLTIASTGAATFSSGIGIGAATATTGGIQFPATQVAIADANNLDDYEEGTWTPGLKFAASTVGITYSAQSGTYTKIGRQVTVNGYFSLSNKGAAAGQAVITGLPFTIANTAGNYAPATLRFNIITYTGTVMGLANINDTTIGMEQVSVAGTLTDITNTNFANTSSVILSLTYFV